MDAPEKPKRRWWRKKRWWAAGLLWLSLCYVLSAGPVRYAIARGWMPDWTFHTFYRPVWKVAIRLRLHNAWGAHHSWWHSLGERHRTKVCNFGGPGWEIVVSSDLECPGPLVRWVGDVATFVSEWGRWEIVVENGRQTSDGGFAWDGPVLFDGRPVATLPTGTRRLSIGFFDGELAIEADGEAVEVED